MMKTSDQLRFVPMNSFVDTTFWSRLTELKLQKFQLDESPKPITATFTNQGISSSITCALNLDHDSFDLTKVPPRHYYLYSGDLVIYNTVDNFKRSEKAEILRDYGSKIFECIKSGQALTDPSKINNFLLLAFADLKKYLYYYWFALPAIGYPDNLKCGATKTLTEVYNEHQIRELESCINGRSSPSPVFVIEILDDAGAKFICRPLEDIRKEELHGKNMLLGFCDPSNDPQHPGWPLRNLLALWSYYRGVTTTEVLCWRQSSQNGVASCLTSILITVFYDKPTSVSFKTYGWEKNERGQLAPRFVNLSRSMDPKKLANEALTLNLQLMRWRLVPEINLEDIFKTSCLIFGAGTLGCNVARGLLGWGVRNITFVDNAMVSFSNPVRQTLYTFQDCVSTDHSKAQVAVEALKKIFPSVNATGFRLNIPMPGHAVADTEWDKAKTDLQLLDDLIKKHDVIFLLLDSRESRWLPAALGALHGKLVISAALGFESYLVMRHGVGLFDKYPLPTNPCYLAGDALGCYFCCDVTAPCDSLTDRTLDQQCTVTRPGASFIASGYAVELMVTTLQHPAGVLAPACCRVSTAMQEKILLPEAEYESCLGIVPHQIRGFLSRFEQFTPTVQRFAKCICCSSSILEKLKGADRLNFLHDVFNNPETLERITGLEAFINDADLDDILALSDNDSQSSL